MQVIIDNKPYEVQEGMTIEQACMQAGIRIPTLCNLKDVSSNASCGICVVEVKGAKSLLRSCITKVTDGMEITTNNARILRARKMNVELLLANHPLDCQTCERNQRCELQQITYEFGIDQRRLPRTRPKRTK
jgi:NADH-quinone oxidoreductase subunit G